MSAGGNAVKRVVTTAVAFVLSTVDHPLVLETEEQKQRWAEMVAAMENLGMRVESPSTAVKQ